MTIWNDLTELDYRHAFVQVGTIRTRALHATPAEPAVGDANDVVVMLHGTSGHLEAFVRNIGPFAHAGYEVHAIDMIGHGYTDSPGKPYRIPDYVEHVLGYLDVIGARRASFVGESLGGWVAARLASDHPERVSSLILAAPGGTVANPEVMERIRSSTSRAVATDDVQLTRDRLELLMHDPSHVTDELVEVRHRIYHRTEFIVNLGNLLALQTMENRRQDLLSSDQLARIAAPTLIVWGNENPFGGVPEAEQLSRSIPRSQLVLYSECGHWPQYEHAAQFNKDALGFLETPR